MDKKRVGIQCRALRQSLGYSQKDVADAVGCGKANISNFENGRNKSYRVLLWYVARGLVLTGEKGEGDI